jgi:uncharacterized membrane protein
LAHYHHYHLQQFSKYQQLVLKLVHLNLLVLVLSMLGPLRELEQEQEQQQQLVLVLVLVLQLHPKNKQQPSLSKRQLKPVTI